MDEIPEKLNVETASTLAQKIKLDYKTRLDTVSQLEEFPPDYSLSFLESLRYRVLPWTLSLVSVLASQTAIGRLIDSTLSLTETDQMQPTQINWITNILAVLLAIAEPVNSYLSTQPFNWGTFAVTILGAVVAYFTGKSGMAAQDSGVQKKQ
jgi:hypothetical protein